MKRSVFPPTLGETAAIIFYLAGVYAFACGFLSWRYNLVDDAFITFRYAENIAAGHGIVWNIGGPHTEGYTSPLLVAILVPWVIAGGTPLWFTKLLGVLTSVVLLPVFVVWVTSRYGWARHHPLRLVSLLMVALPLFMHPTIIHALSGMETNLTLLVYAAWGMVIHLVWERSATRPGSWRTGALLAVCGFVVSLVRSEAGAIAVAGLGGLLMHARTRRVGAIGIGGFFALLGAYLIFKYAYFGYLLPNPYYHKVATDAARKFAGWDSVRGFTTYLQIPFVVAIAGLLAALANRRFFFTPLEVLAGGAVMFYVVFFLKVEPVMNYDFRFSWHCLPYLLVLVIGALWRLTEVGVEAPAPSRSMALTAAAAAVVLGGTGGLALLAANEYVSPLTLQTMRNPRRPAMARNGGHYGAHERIGKTLGAMRLPYETTVNGMEAGLIPYFARTRAIDLVGLNDNVITRGTPEERVAYLAANPLDVDYTLSTTGAVDDFANNDQPWAAEQARTEFARRAKDFWFAGSYYWGVDAKRRYFNFWVRRSHPEASRIRLGLIRAADSFRPLVTIWHQPHDALLFNTLHFPSLNSAGLDGLSAIPTATLISESNASGLVALPQTDPSVLNMQATSSDPGFLNRNMGSLAHQAVLIISYDMKLRTSPESTITSQLYWAGPGGSLAEANSLSRPLKTTTEWQTVAFPVGGHPGWSELNAITTLRFDPVDAPVAFELRNPQIHRLPP